MQHQSSVPPFQGASTVLVTGGAGYIGSHAVLALKRAGFRVVVLDNLVYGHRDIVEDVLQVDFIEGDISDRPLLDSLFQQYSIAAVMHFAAYAYVGESVKEPAKYYRNNVTGTLTLLEAMVAAGVKNIVFSSTCASYGVPQTVPIAEDHPQSPINPYGMTKLMVEQMLQDFDAAYGLKSVRFRYFNASGADPDGQLGEDHIPETHLIPLVLFTALGARPSISIFGTDYPTPDGTCIRDYIHVSDLADAHVLGLQHLLSGASSEVFNLGNGNGFSVKEVIDAARAITGKPIPVVESDRRPGDPPALVGSAAKAQSILGWEPNYPDIKDMIRHAWAWHQKRHGSSDSTPTDPPSAVPSSPNEPLVSVVIPAYNAATFIGQTLRSVMAQTYENLEIIVVNDGSQDETVDIVQDFSANDSRIRLLHQVNAGVAAARNLGIKSARGEFIAPVDADDIWYPNNIALQMEAMRRGGPGTGLVYSWSVDIDESGQPTGGFRATAISGNVYTTLIGHNFIGNASATLIRRRCLEEVGGYDSTLRAQQAQGCEDWDLYLRIAEQYDFQVAPHFLIGYRKLDSSMSCDYRAMAKSHSLVMARVKARHPELPAYLWKLSRSNLYIYFAHQSNRYGQHSVTRFWLKEALLAETMTPFLRLGFYRLSLRSTIGAWTQPVQDVSTNGSSDDSHTDSPSDCAQPAVVSFKAPRLTLGMRIK